MACTKRLKKIQPALAYAAAHLDEDVSLAALAEQTGLSAFHLQRVFAETVGESPKQLTLRLRLERAAALLLTGEDSVLEVALACGFQSHEVFIRAFRKRFGLAPRAYRERGFSQQTGGDQAKTHAALVNQVGPCVDLYRIQDQPRRNSVEYSIAKKALTAQPALVMKRRVKRSEIAQALGEMFGRIYQQAQGKGIALAGPPFARYFDWGPGMTTMEGGFPVAAPVAETGDAEVLAETLPGGPAAITMHSGAYDTLSQAHAAIQIWIEAQGLTPSGAPWESYITDPGQFPDPKDWKTEVVWPLQG
ncbi:MAG TPA: AraC family transcriptional regulator [Bryobacteraceae bacterium]|nr:AraC family transcriptional regulator [Bryobacteraceae bacterium]